MMVTRLNPLDRFIVFIATYFGEHSKEVERFLRFSVVGTIGAIVDFGTLNVLQLTLLSPINPHQELKIILASALAFCAAVSSNFIWNRYWTYPDSRSRSVRRQLAQFFMINAAGLVFRVVFVALTFHLFGELGANIVEDLNLVANPDHKALVNQVGTNISQGLSMIIVMF